jgi:hypothetical protein
LSKWARSGRAIVEAQAMGIRLRIWSHQPVELTVLDAVPDIMSFVVDVVTLRTGQTFEPSAGMLRAVIGTTKDDLA